MIHFKINAHTDVRNYEKVFLVELMMIENDFLF